MDEDDRERLAGVFKGLAHPTRIAVIEGVRRGDALVDIANRLDVSRGTLQDHKEMLLREELIYELEDGGYELTPVGEVAVSVLDEFGEDFVVRLRRAEELREEVEEDIGPSELPISDEELERAVDAATWERLGEDLD